MSDDVSEHERITVRPGSAYPDDLASVRHDLRNKLASVRNAVHYLRRRVDTTDLAANDPRIERFFALIEDELRAADGVIVERLGTRRE